MSSYDPVLWGGAVVAIVVILLAATVIGTWEERRWRKAPEDTRIAAEQFLNGSYGLLSAGLGAGILTVVMFLRPVGAFPLLGCLAGDGIGVALGVVLTLRRSPYLFLRPEWGHPHDRIWRPRRLPVVLAGVPFAIVSLAVAA